MVISGLTVLKNAIRLGYPFLEAIRSALPICDEFVVVVGDSDDGTLEAIRGLNETRLRIVETVWSEKVRPRQCVLAQQTNIGLHLCQGDWTIYLQANEILHESSLPVLLALMKEHKEDLNVEALLLQRLSFWGDYQHYLRVYPHRFKFSPRIVRPYLGTYSIRDAMSFAVFDGFSVRGRYPRALDTGEDIYRYSYVGTPQQMENKFQGAVHFSHSGEVRIDEEYLYRAHVKSFVREFKGTHPEVMKERIQAFPQKISLLDHRWRTKPTAKEKQRLVETWFYERFGMPHFRNTRYALIGGYVRKKRE